MFKIRSLAAMLLLLPAVVRAQLPDSTRDQSVTASYEYNRFDQATRFNWHLGSIEYKRQLPKLAIMGRLNYSQRFGNKGWQGEVEAYPRISRRVYAYTALGYSPHMPVFPTWRAGASLYVNLTGGWEAEGGTRYLYFDRPIWMLTSGMGKYLGNWFVQARGFFTLNPGQPLGQSFMASARYYLPGYNNYLWVLGGTGISPDESGLAQLRLTTLQRRNLAAGIRATVAKKHILMGSVGYARNEYRKQTYGDQLTLQAGYGIRF